MLSQEIYRRAWRVTSLFGRARQTQIDMGAPASKCLVIPNGIQYERFCDIPLKPEDGLVDIGAVVRLAPIKDVKPSSTRSANCRTAWTMSGCTSSVVWTTRTMPTNAMSW